MTPARTWTRRAVAAIVATILGSTLAEPGPARAAGPARASASPPTEPFEVASWNVLGHSHTAAGGRKHRQGWASGTTRVRWAFAKLEREGYDVAGLQEIQLPQRRAFRRHVAPGWSMANRQDNAVVWRTSQFRLVAARSIAIPYFRGVPKRMPFVLLEQRSTGARLWVASFHNPADTRGPARVHRDRAALRQIALARRLSATGTPVVFAGDFNERWRYVCKLHRRTDLRSFVGGGVRGGRCITSRRWNGIDWVLGNRRVDFSRPRTLRDASVRRTADHPLVGARVTLRR